MRTLLFFLLLPTASALSIAASPEVIRFDRFGEAALFLFNPSSNDVQYTLESDVVQPLTGTLFAHTSTRVVLHPQFLPQGNTLRITFISATGSTHIQIAPSLELPVEYTPQFSILWLVLLLFFLLGLVLVLLLLF